MMTMQMITIIAPRRIKVAIVYDCAELGVSQ